MHAVNVMSAKTRKTVGSFVSESNAGLIQQSPRLDLKEIYERNPYVMATHNSKTNFIVDSVLPEGPRAVAVSQTGEKHMLHLDESVFNVSNTNPFAHNSTSQLAPGANNASNISNETNSSGTKSQTQTPLTNTTSATKVQSITIERPRLNSAKRSKGSRRYINQKPRPVFTPRNLDKILTPHLSEERAKRVTTKQYNAQTQTDYIPAQKSHTCHHMTIKQSPRMEQKRYQRENIGDMLKVNDSPRAIGELRLIPPCNKSKTTDFSELRNIASAITLLTVVSWLFSTFFELEGISELFSSLTELLENWFVKKEQPITKAEMLVNYFKNWWQ